MFASEYNALFVEDVEDHEAEKNTPCPPEFAKTQILEVDGFKCKVFYNYVAPYNFGVNPMNCWWGLACIGNYSWCFPVLNDVIKRTVEKASDIILPEFIKAIQRIQAKQGYARI